VHDPSERRERAEEKKEKEERMFTISYGVGKNKAKKATRQKTHHANPEGKKGCPGMIIGRLTQRQKNVL